MARQISQSFFADYVYSAPKHVRLWESHVVVTDYGQNMVSRVSEISIPLLTDVILRIPDHSPSPQHQYPEGSQGILRYCTKKIRDFCCAIK